MNAPFLALITPVGGTSGPVDPGYSPPWAQVPPGTRPPVGGGGPVDPGYSPPWAQVRPPVDPGYSPPWAQVPPGYRPPGPVDPGYSPPWAQVRPPYPDHTLPGDLPYPDNTLPGDLPGVGQPVPPPVLPEPPKFEKVTAWTPQTGWVVVYVPQFPTPTPSTTE